MASAAILRGCNAVTSASHPFGLYLNSLDLIRAPGLAGSYGVSLDSIHITELGANGNGTMTFGIDDPAKEITLTGGEEVMMWDFAVGEPLFLGTIENFTKRPAFGQQGRAYEINCVDYNAELDRNIIPSDTRPANSADRQAHIQYLAGLYSNLRQFGNPWSVGNIGASTQDMPVGTTWSNQIIGAPSLLSETVVISGQTLRNAIDQISAASAPTVLLTAYYKTALYFVDFYKGLRYYTGSIGNAPYNLNDAGPKYAEELSYEVDSSQVVNAVYVQGANANGSGWVRDSASIATYGERQGFLSQTDSDTSTKRDSYGQDFLDRADTALLRVSYKVSGPGYEGLHAGQTQNITNVSLGLVGVPGTITSVETDFDGGAGHRTWRVTWGGSMPHSMTRLVRKLIR